jgi:hypothetical protein
MRKTVAKLIMATATLFALAACVTEKAVVKPAGGTDWPRPGKGPEHALVTIHEFSDF